jgi:hypothetical protein
MASFRTELMRCCCTPAIALAVEIMPRDPGSSSPGPTPPPAAAEIKLEIARHRGQSATSVQCGRDQLPCHDVSLDWQEQPASSSPSTRSSLPHSGRHQASVRAKACVRGCPLQTARHFLPVREPRIQTLPTLCVLFAIFSSGLPDPRTSA